jgi:translation initiation factor 2 beta subunit (eIF-2beta)/eIF-5
MSSSTKVNIGGSSNDSTWRYKRDKIKTKFNAAKNGQTLILNIDVISQQLKIPVDNIIKIMQKEIGVPIRKGNIIPGEIKVEKLEAALEKIIIKYVLCIACSLPELATDKTLCNGCGKVQKIKT